LTVWTLLTFAGLLFVLARYAFRPLQRILDERERKLRSALDTADQARREAEALLAQNAQRLDEARVEARRIISEGHRIVADMKREGQAAAKQEADRVVREAQGEVEREIRNSLDELKATVANLSLRIARQVLREQMDEKRHGELVEEFIARLKQSHGDAQR
jgi:F-type H+-transporting ATPase subunit b